MRIVLASCDHICQTTYVTTWGEKFTLVYCSQGACIMAKSTTKTVLFCAARVDSKNHTWPVAVFNDVKQARPYAALLRLAYKSGDRDGVMALDPKAPIPAETAMPKDCKFSVVQLPYSPEMTLGSDDPFDTSAPPAATS